MNQASSEPLDTLLSTDVGTEDQNKPPIDLQAEDSSLLGDATDTTQADLADDAIDTTQADLAGDLVQPKDEQLDPDQNDGLTPDVPGDSSTVDAPIDTSTADTVADQVQDSGKNDTSPDTDPADQTTDLAETVEPDSVSDQNDAEPGDALDVGTNSDQDDAEQADGDQQDQTLADQADQDDGAIDVPPEGQLKTTLKMKNFRRGHSATLLDDGRVLIAGGLLFGASLPLQVQQGEIYNPQDHTISAEVMMAEPRASHQAVKLADGQVLLIAGSRQYTKGPTNTAELFSTGPDKFTALTATTVFTRSAFSAWRIASGTNKDKVLIVGGLDASRTTLDVAEIYDPVKKEFTTYAETLPAPRYFPSVTQLSDGRVLLLGGQFRDSNGDVTILDDGVIFDPTDGKFSSTPKFSGPRFSHTASLLPDGRVWIVGGKSEQFSGYLSTTLFYDPVKNEFTDGPTLGDVRASHTAVTISATRILIIGGTNGTTVAPSRQHRFSDGYLYDTVLKELILTPAGVEKVEMTGTAIGNDSALLVGGAIGFNTITSDMLDVWLP